MIRLLREVEEDLWTNSRSPPIVSQMPSVIARRQLALFLTWHWRQSGSILTNAQAARSGSSLQMHRKRHQFTANSSAYPYAPLAGCHRNYDAFR
jgi:hypothetical protein